MASHMARLGSGRHVFQSRLGFGIFSLPTIFSALMVSVASMVSVESATTVVAYSCEYAVTVVAVRRIAVNSSCCMALLLITMTSSSLSNQFVKHVHDVF